MPATLSDYSPLHRDRGGCRRLARLLFNGRARRVARREGGGSVASAAVGALRRGMSRDRGIDPFEVRSCQSSCIASHDL